MNNIAKVALGLTAVMVVAVIGLNLLPGTTGAGAAPPPPASPPRARPVAEWEAYMPPTGALVAGTYDAVSEVDLIPFSFTVADGWNSEGWYLTKSAWDRPAGRVRHVHPGRQPAGRSLRERTGVARGGTDRRGSCPRPACLPGIDASPTLDATLDGRAGRLVDTSSPRTSRALGAGSRSGDPVGGALWEPAVRRDRSDVECWDVDGSRFVVTA